MRSMGLEFCAKADEEIGGGWGLSDWNLKGGGVVLPERPDLPRFPEPFLDLIAFRNALTTTMIVKRTTVPVHEPGLSSVVLIDLTITGGFSVLAAGVG